MFFLNFKVILFRLLGCHSLIIIALNCSFISSAEALDLDHDNAAIDLVIPTAVIGIFDASATAGDATLVLRHTTMLTNSWFDATAPYHATAIGVYSRLGRRPVSESITNYNINVAVLHASYRVLNSLFPHQQQHWRDMLISQGLNPDNNSTDLTTAEGIGNAAGNAVVAVRENDGMNQLGNKGDRAYHHQPYADYTNFIPANSAYELTNPSLWQPAITSNGKGLFKVQQFVTPQLRLVKPYSYRNPRRFKAPFPYQSQVGNFSKYKAQADEVLRASANLTDRQKMLAELFDNKIFSLGFSGVFAAKSQGLNILDTIHYEFLTNMAAFDTAIVIWKEKARYNAVRPHSAIKYIYGDDFVTAWGGVGIGTVFDLPASEWTSYLPVADHPEYPSASASFCAAHAQASRLFLGSDQLNWSVPVAAGSSLIETGITPVNDLTLDFSTWSQLEHECGISRFWAGVHFMPSIPAGQNLGHRVAYKAYRFIRRKIRGKKR